MPSIMAIVAMVNEGWDFDTLMDMSAESFGVWYEAQRLRNEELAKRQKA